jgi:membrane glycosyltransferase
MISPHSDMTPAGVQSRALLFCRRLIVAGLNIITYLALLVWLAQILGTSGWSAIDVAIFVCFAVAAPWSVSRVSSPRSCSMARQA